MKKKLTVTVDEKVLPKAKAYAKAHGCSLSYVIEESLRGLVSKDAEPFSSRWKGRFQDSIRHSEEDSARYRILSQRYG